MTERTLAHGTREYEKLELVAKMLTFESPNMVWYRVGDTYLDIGQDWEWTTVLACPRIGCGWQALSPKEWKEIMLAEDTLALVKIVKEHFADKYCPDHK